MPELHDTDIAELILLLETKEDEIVKLKADLVTKDKDLIKLERQRDMMKTFCDSMRAVLRKDPKPIPIIELSEDEENQFKSQVAAVEQNRDKWKNVYSGLKETAFKGIRQALDRSGLG